MFNWIEYTAPQWRNLHMRQLNVDEAYLVPSSNYKTKTYLYSLSDECYTCPYTKVKAIQTGGTVEALKINVAFPNTYKVFEEDAGKYAYDNATALCTARTSMKEFGVYNFTIHANGSCEFATDKPGVNVNLSILSVCLLGMLIAIVSKLFIYAMTKWRSASTVEIVITPEMDEADGEKTMRKRRMRSLDTFRGLVIVLMIFVNSGGGGYWWMEHAPWNGLHVADIVFPMFLWIMGVCIPISIKSQLSKGSTKRSICKKIAWRSLKMFVIGICLNSVNGPQLQDLRIMGVLQRFGIAYFVVGTVHTIFRSSEYVVPQSIRQRLLFDLWLIRKEFLVMASLIALSLGITFGVSAPGCPTGYIGPGGKHSYAAYPECTGGIYKYIDLEVLGKSHIYQHSTAKALYESTGFDPEGLFGCLLTIVQVFVGVICGSILITHVEWHDRVKRWISWSIVLGLLGGGLCFFSPERGWIPINKNLWSLSFVLVTSSLAFFLLSIMYYIVDVRQSWSGFPFAECGMNAIILYVGHSVFHKMLPWHWMIGAMNTHFILLLKCAWNTALWIATAVYLDRVSFYYTL